MIEAGFLPLFDDIDTDMAFQFWVDLKNKQYYRDYNHRPPTRMSAGKEVVIPPDPPFKHL